MGPRGQRNGRPAGRPRNVVLEEPNEQKDYDDKGEKSATDIHSGLLCAVDVGTTRPLLDGLRGNGSLPCARHGAVAEWLGRGLQSLAHQFDSGRRLSLVHAETGVVEPVSAASVACCDRA